MRPARLIAPVVAVLGGLAIAAPAQAALVYQKTTTDRETRAKVTSVHIAADDGTNPRKLADGALPRISPDGQHVAYMVQRGRLLDLNVIPAAGGEPRRLTTSTEIDSVRFSPDGKLVAAEVGARRIVVYQVDTGFSRVVARGRIRGFSFSPDSASLVYGRSEADGAFTPSDLHKVAVTGGEPEQLTDDGRSLLPIWGPSRIAFVKRKGAGGGGGYPAYDIWTITPAGQRSRRLTVTKVPAMSSGLLPIEYSADGRRLLAQYVGKDVQIGFTVNPSTGDTRALSRSPTRGKVAFALSGDGAQVLTMSGGPDPDAKHNIVVTPYERGEASLLVRNAAYPDWSK